MLKHNVAILFILIILPNLTLAEDLQVIKTAPSEIRYGENLQVNITVKNTSNQQVIADVKEVIGDAEAVSPQLVIPEMPEELIAAIPPYFEWALTIASGSQESVTYTIKPKNVGIYAFSPTLVALNDGRTFFSNSLSTEILCNSNNLCEIELGENYFNCPNDCKQGGKDNVCNPTRDDTCDLDCAEGADLDCLQPQSTGGQLTPPLNLGDLLLPLAGGIIVIGGVVTLFFFRNKLPKIGKTKQKETSPAQTKPKEQKKRKTKGFCSNCGKPIKKEALFCSNCGAKQ